MFFAHLKSWVAAIIGRPGAKGGKDESVHTRPIKPSAAPELPQFGVPVGAVDSPETLVLGSTSNKSHPDFASPREVDPKHLEILEALYAGIAFMHGYDRTKDLGRAAACLRIAADAGNARAQSLLGQLLLELPGQNSVEAVKQLERAADQAQTEAIALLGTFYERGLHVPCDLARAVEYYHRGTEIGCTVCHRRLGMLLVSDACRHDMRGEGIRLLEVAAVSGDVEAQQALSHVLAKGDPEHRDLSRALMWATRAVSGGAHQARDTVASVLHPTNLLGELESSGADGIERVY